MKNDRFAFTDKEIVKDFVFPVRGSQKIGNDDVTVLYCEKNTMDEWLFVNGVCDMID